MANSPAFPICQFAGMRLPSGMFYIAVRTSLLFFVDIFKAFIIFSPIQLIPAWGKPASYGNNYKNLVYSV
jgi:hypothetical protein